MVSVVITAERHVRQRRSSSAFSHKASVRLPVVRDYARARFPKREGASERDRERERKGESGREIASVVSREKQRQTARNERERNYPSLHTADSSGAQRERERENRLFATAVVAGRCNLSARDPPYVVECGVPTWNLAALPVSLVRRWLYTQCTGRCTRRLYVLHNNRGTERARRPVL